MIQSNRRLPSITKTLEGGDSLAVEVHGLFLAPKFAVHRTCRVPCFRLASSVTETTLDDSCTLIEGQGFGCLAKGLLNASLPER